MEKRNLFSYISVLVVLGLGFSSLQAACPRDSSAWVSGGIKIEANAFEYFMPDISTSRADVKMGPGASIAGFVYLDLHRYFGIQMEYVVNLKTARLFSTPYKGDLLYVGSEIPFYFVFQYGMKNCHRFYFGAGPSVAFGYYAGITTPDGRYDLYDKDGPDELSALRTCSMGFAAMMGYEFAFGLQLNVSYHLGFYNVLDARRTEVEAFPHTVSAGIGYRFGIHKHRKGGKDVR